jgi:hypothetical protein
VVFGTAVGLNWYYREGLRCDLWCMVLRWELTGVIRGVCVGTCGIW